MSEAEKNWWKECCGGSETERGLRAEIPTHIDWNGEMSATLAFSPKKIDEIMNKLAGNEEEKDMNTEKLKDKIKKVIYVDKEMTVREPVLDSNGKCTSFAGFTFDGDGASMFFDHAFDIEKS